MRRRRSRRSAGRSARRLSARSARRSMRRSRACSTAAAISSAPRSRRSSSEFAAYIGARHAVGVGQRHRRAGAGAAGARSRRPSDYVVTVSHTAVATVAAIELAGARPLLVDIDPATYDARSGARSPRALATPPGRIAAVMPVHLYGQAADLDAIARLARRHGVRVIEDCAQSHGARYRRPAARRLRRSRRLQLLSDQESRRASAMAAWS